MNDDISQQPIEPTQPIRVIDKRKKQYFVVDDVYLNGYARMLGPTASMVYIALCRHVDRNQSAFPSQKRIAEEIGVNEQTVKEKVKELKEWNIISTTRNRDKRGYLSKNIYILLDKSVWKYPQVEKAPMESTGGKSTPSPQVEKAPIIKDTHKTKDIKKELLRNNSKESVVENKQKNIDIVLSHFNKLFQRTYRPTTGREQKLRLRLKTFSMEQILQAITTLSQSPWHKGENDRGWVANPDFLLRSDEQIDKWLQQQTAPEEPFYTPEEQKAVDEAKEKMKLMGLI